MIAVPSIHSSSEFIQSCRHGFLPCSQVVEGEIQQKKEELEESKLRKQHLEEYEQLKKLIMCYPKRSETEASIQKITSDISDLQRESRRLDQTIEVRPPNHTLVCTVDRRVHVWK